MLREIVPDATYVQVRQALANDSFVNLVETILRHISALILKSKQEGSDLSMLFSSVACTQKTPVDCKLWSFARPPLFQALAADPLRFYWV